MSKCKSCGAEIKWITTLSGKKMPVDTERIHFFPDQEGKETFVTDGGSVVKGVRASRDDTHTHTGYITHFATCPNADSHRKLKEAGRSAGAYADQPTLMSGA